MPPTPHNSNPYNPEGDEEDFFFFFLFFFLFFFSFKKIREQSSNGVVLIYPKSLFFSSRFRIVGFFFWVLGFVQGRLFWGGRRGAKKGVWGIATHSLQSQATVLFFFLNDFWNFSECVSVK